MEAELKNDIIEVLSKFTHLGKYQNFESYGNGHINSTFVVNYEDRRIILQAINTNVFKDPVALMDNIARVTEFLKSKIILAGGDINRETLNLIKTDDDAYYVIDSKGKYWRAYVFVEDTISYEQISSKELFMESGYSFGHFQNLLSDFDATMLHETIKDFHNTEKRFENFLRAVENDKLKRAKEVEKEIQFFLDRKEDTKVLNNLLKNNEISLRVTHNDTKLNNILMDKYTGKGICIIDLDTIMPGFSVNDFGDSIRFGANTALEDEIDLSKVSLSLDLFESYARGFLAGCNNILSDKEVELLPFGAKIMTFECGMRFLTDYLEGDTYFKIHRPKHNLDRARTQIALVLDMEKKWDKMHDIIKKVSK